MSIGGWKGMMPEKEVQKYFVSSQKRFVGAKIFNNDLTFSIKDNRIHISKNFKIGDFLVTAAWKKVGNNFSQIPEGKTDLSYNQILRAIKHLNSLGFSDSQLANLQLLALSGSYPKSDKPTYEQTIHFLNYLNALMFGIESSGLNAGLVISLMTLDLIAQELFTYQLAFNANSDGGIYPYATFGDNKNTYKNREDILSQKSNSVSMKRYRDNPSLSPVALKEVILIKTWLKSKKLISKDEIYENQIGIIANAVSQLAAQYLF